MRLYFLPATRTHNVGTWQVDAHCVPQWSDWIADQMFLVPQQVWQGEVQPALTVPSKAQALPNLVEQMMWEDIWLLFDSREISSFPVTPLRPPSYRQWPDRWWSPVKGRCRRPLPPREQEKSAPAPMTINDSVINLSLIDVLEIPGTIITQHSCSIHCCRQITMRIICWQASTCAQSPGVKADDNADCDCTSETTWRKAKPNLLVQCLGCRPIKKSGVQ